MSETLASSTRRMAVGTVASRATGFLRTAMIAGVLGVLGVGDAYNVANTIPNIVYDLLLGGVLSSVVVPLLVRAAAEEGDEAEACTQRLLTLTIAVLGAACLVLVVLAPQLVHLYAGGLRPREEQLAVVFARLCLPQVAFYGIGAILGALLNVRGRFAPPMWAPVVNNGVVIGTALLFLLLPGPRHDGGPLLTGAQVALLGLGTTLGIVGQTVALLPSLRAAGFRWRLRRDLRGVGLGTAGRLARWVLLYVVANQVAFFVVVRLATDKAHVADGRGYTSFVNAFVLWQLPHAIVAVSVITALLPGMSRAAAEGRTADLRAILNRGLRLTSTVLVPATAAYVVLGPAVATVVLAHGRVSVPQARYMGLLLAVLALGLVPFSAYQLQLRAFYAMQDTRTPTLVNLAVNVTMIGADLVLYALLSPGHRVLGLAVGQSLSYAVGLAVCSRVLGRRLDGLDGALAVRTAVRCLVAAAPAGLAGLAVARAAESVLGRGPAAAAATLLLAGATLAACYVALARRMRVHELDEVAGPLLRRLAGRPTRRR